MAFSFSRLACRCAVAASVALAGLAPLDAFALTAADVAPLADDDFDAKSAAIDKLVASGGDPHALALLKALSEDNALATHSGRVLIQLSDSDTPHDAATGKAVSADAPH